MTDQQRIVALEAECHQRSSETSRIAARCDWVGEERDALRRQVTDLKAERDRYKVQSEQADKAVIAVGANIERLTDQMARDREERDALRQRIADFEADFREVLSGACAPDEQHCSCVPHLRRGLAEAVPAFVARVNARAEADWLAGRSITGAHHRALVAELAPLVPPAGGSPSGTAAEQIDTLKREFASLEASLKAEKAALLRSSSAGAKAKIEAIDARWRAAKQDTSDKVADLHALEVRTRRAEMSAQTRASEREAVSAARDKSQAVENNSQIEREAEDIDRVVRAGGFDAVLAQLRQDLAKANSAASRTSPANKWKIDSRIAAITRDLARVQALADKGQSLVPPAETPVVSQLAPPAAETEGDTT